MCPNVESSRILWWLIKSLWRKETQKVLMIRWNFFLEASFAMIFPGTDLGLKLPRWLLSSNMCVSPCWYVCSRTNSHSQNFSVVRRLNIWLLSALNALSTCIEVTFCHVNPHTSPNLYYLVSKVRTGRCNRHRHLSQSSTEFSTWLANWLNKLIFSSLRWLKNLSS